MTDFQAAMFSELLKEAMNRWNSDPARPKVIGMAAVHVEIVEAGKICPISCVVTQDSDAAVMAIGLCDAAQDCVALSAGIRPPSEVTEWPM